MGATKLIQPMYFKNIMALKFGTKDMLLCKRGSAFVFTEDGKLQIPSRLIWFDQGRPPKRVLVGVMAQVTQHSEKLQCSLTDLYSQDLTITLNFLRIPQRLPASTNPQEAV